VGTLNPRVEPFYKKQAVILYHPAFQAVLHDGGLRVVGVDQDGEARIVELPDHPFFLATLFVPQLTSRPGHPHPLITAYLRVAMQLREETQLAGPAKLAE
jgi:CTP synthase (UTP-ammonia lyase)